VKQVKSPGQFSQFFHFLLSALLVLTCATVLCAQSPSDGTQSASPGQSSSGSALPSPNPTQSAEALQTRITRARALIAAHQLATAARELESLRGGTQDYILRNVTSIMLMNVYLEEGNYIRAEALLEETFQARSSKNDDSIRTYFALAGQAINGARAHLSRYRNLGINTTDANLPAEALNDLSRLRSLLERMIAQAREISNNRRAYDSLSLLEDVLGLRLSLAKDFEDQTKWQNEYTRAREALASSQTEVASLGGGPMVTRTQQSGVAVSNLPRPPTGQQSDNSRPGSTSSEAGSNGQASESVNTGFLNSRATKKVVPLYPDLARQRGDTGLVRVYVVVDETGKVVEVSRSEGPLLLRQAAEDAARQWSFEASSNGGRPVRLIGYIDFNFTL